MKHEHLFQHIAIISVVWKHRLIVNHKHIFCISMQWRNLYLHGVHWNGLDWGAQRAISSVWY